MQKNHYLWGLQKIKCINSYYKIVLTAFFHKFSTISMASKSSFLHEADQTDYLKRGVYSYLAIVERAAGNRRLEPVFAAGRLAEGNFPESVDISSLRRTKMGRLQTQ